MAASDPIWIPSAERIAGANLTAFARSIERQSGSALADYADLHRFSVERPAEFWSALWDFMRIVGDRGERALAGDGTILGTQWFPDARLNFAENHLRRRDNGSAIVARDEAGRRRVVSWRALHDSVVRLRGALVAFGVTPGDRVVGYLPNVPEAVIAALATTSLGAIWSTCSPDYAVDAVIERFAPLAPKVLFVADRCRYHGKDLAIARRNHALTERLPSLAGTVIVDGDCGSDASLPSGASRWSDAMAHDDALDAPFERFPFDHPAYVLFSSGTTGVPKAIVHGAGGALLQTMKEMALHCDARRDEPVFWPTTTGWMVWNVMVGSLACGAPIVLHDGSPTWPSESSMFDVIAEERVGIARLVPPLLRACSRAGVVPRESHDLSALRCIVSGGSPLLPEHIEYVYRSIKSDVHLMSPAGGTDIMGTLATGNPTAPVYAGEIQCPSLGMAVEVFDDDGLRATGGAGELVCTRPFPTVPLAFWGRPRAAVEDEYFNTFPGVWRHGDWAEITPRGGIVIHGRSDATLKTSGVRIATADLYRAIGDIPEIVDSAAVNLDRDGDSHIVLFVVLAARVVLDDEMRARVRSVIRDANSPKHVPGLIVQVPDLLRSLNGKPSEIAMRDAINGRPLRNAGGLSNADLLPLYGTLKLEPQRGLERRLSNAET